VENKTWIDVAFAFVAAIPATIAAISSLRNGKKISRVENGRLKNDRDARGVGSARVRTPDWFKHK
jgi:hypothetical protein